MGPSSATRSSGSAAGALCARSWGCAWRVRAATGARGRLDARGEPRIRVRGDPDRVDPGAAGARGRAAPRGQRRTDSRLCRRRRLRQCNSARKPSRYACRGTTWSPGSSRATGPGWIPTSRPPTGVSWLCGIRRRKQEVRLYLVADGRRIPRARPGNARPGTDAGERNRPPRHGGVPRAWRLTAGGPRCRFGSAAELEKRLPPVTTRPWRCGTTRTESRQPVSWRAKKVVTGG